MWFKLYSVFSIFLINFLIVSQGDDFGHENKYYEKLLSSEILSKIGSDFKNTQENIVSSCLKDLMLLGESLNEQWALQMLDSFGKPPAGILKGNLNSFGQFDECLEISHNVKGADRPIMGQYCLAQLPISVPQSQSLIQKHKYSERLKAMLGNTKLETFGNVYESKTLVLNLGVCVPDSCSASDVEQLLEGLLNMTETPGKAPVFIQESSCSRGMAWDAGDWVAIAILAFFILLLVLSTAYDMWYSIYKQAPPTSSVLIAFSVWTNTKRLLSSSRRQPLSCLHGMRVLSMFWVILGHRFILSLIFPSQNPLDFIAWSEMYSSMPIFGAEVSVDTFFLIGGLLLSYVFFKQMEKESYFNVPMFYLHRYLRLTPALGVMVLLQATLFRHVADGPIWHGLNSGLAESCRKYWWTTLLYVQNYVNPNEICIGQSWFLSVDMQLYVLAPLMLYPLLKRPLAGLLHVAFWIVASLVAVFVICYVYAWPAAAMPINDITIMEERMEQYYYPMHTRATPWLVGFMAGYFLHYSTRRTIRFNKWLVGAGWICSLLVFAAVVLGMQPLQMKSHTFSYLEDTTYLAFNRTAWAVACLWVIVACAHGYGGPVNWFLCLRVWEVLGRLSYSMYLVHLPMQFMMSSAMRNPPYFSKTSSVYQYFSDLVVTIFFALLLVLLFESPITILEKQIFKPNKKSRSEEVLKEVVSSNENVAHCSKDEE